MDAIWLRQKEKVFANVSILLLVYNNNDSLGPQIDRSCEPDDDQAVTTCFQVSFYQYIVFVAFAIAPTFFSR